MLFKAANEFLWTLVVFIWLSYYEGLFESTDILGGVTQQSQIIKTFDVSGKWAGSSPAYPVVHLSHSIREVRVVILDSLIGLQSAACQYL